METLLIAYYERNLISRCGDARFVYIIVLFIPEMINGNCTFFFLPLKCIFYRFLLTKERHTDKLTIAIYRITDA